MAPLVLVGLVEEGGVGASIGVVCAGAWVCCVPLATLKVALPSLSGPLPLLSTFGASEGVGFSFMTTSVLFFTETEIGIEAMYPVALALIE